MGDYENERETPEYTRVINEVYEILSENREIVLATSLGNRVTARTVSFAHKDTDIFFMTWEHNKKVTQISENPKVALTLQNIQIEGVAEIIGKPSDFVVIGDIFRSKISPRWFDTFSQIKEMVLVRVKMKNIVKFETINRRFHLQNINPTEKKVYQMRIEDRTHPQFPK